MEKNEIKRIGGYILSAIDMEERFASGVYLDYTDKKNWPADVNKDTYEKIQSLLNILIDDTTRHKNVFVELKKKLARS